MKNTAPHRRAVSQDRKTSPSYPQQQIHELPAEQWIDEYVLERIDFRVRHLASQFDLSEDEQEDCRQDMVAEVLGAFHRFDPDKAKRETFVNRVLGKFVKYATRIRCTHRRRACDSPAHFEDVSPGYQPVVNDMRAGQFDEQGQRELRLDMDAAIARMPERLQRVCRLLMECGPTEAAAKLGICRQSIYRSIPQIREYLTRAGLAIPENSATDSPQLQM